jgi:hypothetical protein
MSLRGIERKVIDQFLNNYFIETGTCGGNGISYALDLNFKNIISIDIVYDDAAYEKFSDNKAVTVITGDSSICLWDTIKNINERITFWLDAHSDLVIKETNWNPVCPLLEELEQIKKHNIKNHDILIDDITPIILLPNFSKQIIEKAIKEINNDYIINYVDTGGTEVLLATTTKGLDYGANVNSKAYK